MQIQFGVGGIFANPTGGNASTPSWPQRMFSIQDVDIEIDRKLVSLMGQNQGPDDVAPSDVSIKGKSGFGFFSPDVFNTLFFGDTVATGSPYNVYTAAATAIPATPFQITPTMPNSGTALSDLGVQFSNNLTYNLQRVASGPTAGQYSYAAGVYTFSSADHTAGLSVITSTSYSQSTVGRSLTAYNHIQGYGPYFELFLPLAYTGNGQDGTNVLHIRRARASKMGFPMKRAGYMISAFEFECFPDASGAWFDLYDSQAG
jgi:hypothetical protein